MDHRKRSLRQLLCLALAFVFFAAGPLFALRARAVTQAQIDELKKALAELNEEASQQQSVIDELTANKGRIVDRKIALDRKIDLTRQQIQVINVQILVYDDMIAEKEIELEEARAVEEAQCQRLRARMRTMEESGTNSYMTFIFMADSFTDLLSRLADITDIMHYDKRLEEEYVAARENVQSIKRSFEEYSLQQDELVRELNAKNEELDSMVAAAQSLIANINELSDDAQAEYDAIAAVRQQTENEIQELLRKLAEEEAARKAAEEAARRAAQGGTSVSGSQAVSLSSLIWPVPSCSVITSRFGNRSRPTAGASTYHGGLDIGAWEGAEIIAAQSGTVIYAGANGGYGNCVMINHGSGIVTLYGHMQSISVRNGQQVSQGQLIGYVGSTGVATGPHCHFEIRINGKQTDPAPYFSGLSYT